MTHSQTRPTHTGRAPRARRLASLAVAVAALLMVVAGCSRTSETTSPTPNDPQVLGLYEFQFDNIGTDEMTASVRRIDTGLSGQAIVGVDPQPGISITLAASGTSSAPGDTDPKPMEPGGGRNYIWGNYFVDNASGQDLTGLTFLGYASTGNSLNGTAFRVAKDIDDIDIDARDVHPGTRIKETVDVGTVLRAAPFKHNFVAYEESEIASLASNLSSLAFVDTVFPYGFAATESADWDGSRTIVTGGQGRVHISFNAPDLKTISWRAVAVVDDRVRTALPIALNHRDGNGFDTFIAEAANMSSANGNTTVEAVVIGEMEQGTRELPGTYVCDAFDFIELGDVRIAGGYGDGTDPAGTPHYLVGDATENSAVDQVTESGAACNGP